jgi:anti-sigma factor RsiW
MDCRRAQELLSDHVDGSLSEILRPDLESHLARCGECRALRDALAEVVDALRRHIVPEPPVRFAERAAARALAVRPLPPRGRTSLPAVLRPAWLQAAAAALLIGSGLGLFAVGPEEASRAADRVVVRAAAAGARALERKDRLVENLRILRVVIATAFEGRLDRVNDRVDDYRRLLERRRARPQGGRGKGDSNDSKKTRAPASEPDGGALAAVPANFAAPRLVRHLEPAKGWAGRFS